MNTFETLIIIPEGSLLNEKLALKSALRQTMKHFGQEFGPAQQLQYTQTTRDFKFKSERDQIGSLLKTFLETEASAKSYFLQKLSDQGRLSKNSASFWNEAKGKIKLIALCREERVYALPRLKKAQIVDDFNALFFADDFKTDLADKNTLLTVIKKTHTDPDSALVIGSNLVEEIQGAENARLKSCWLAPKKEKIPITPHPTLHLSRLTDLLFYLNIE